MVASFCQAGGELTEGGETRKGNPMRHVLTFVSLLACFAMCAPAGASGLAPSFVCRGASGIVMDETSRVNWV